MKKKALFFILNLDIHGLPIIWLTKIKNYQRHGFSTFVSDGISVFKINSIGDVYSYKSEAFQKNSNIKSINTKLGYLIYVIRKNILSFSKIKTFKRYGFDIIYTPSSVLDFLVIPFFVKLQSPTVKWVTVFDNTVPLLGKGNAFIRLLAWIFFQFSILLIKKADLVFTITPDLKKYLISRGLFSSKVIVTGCGVELEMLQSATYQKSKSLDAIYVGRIHENKGVLDLLQVLKSVASVFPNTKLGIMGRGDTKTEEKFKLKINSLGLQKNVVMLGFVTGIEKYNYIKSAKSFWYLSYDDSFGVSLLEAAAMGKKSFVYNLQPFKYIYKNNEIETHKIGDIPAVVENVINYFIANNFRDKNNIILKRKWSWNNIVDTEVSSVNKLL